MPAPLNVYPTMEGFQRRPRMRQDRRGLRMRGSPKALPNTKAANPVGSAAFESQFREPLSVTSWESQVTPGFVAPTPSCFFSRSTDFFVRPFVVLALSFWRLSNRVAAVARIVVLSLPPPTVQVIALFSSHPRKTRYAFHRVFWELCTATGRAWLTRPVLADAVTFLVGFGRGHVRGLGRVGAA